MGICQVEFKFQRRGSARTAPKKFRARNPAGYCFSESGRSILIHLPLRARPMSRARHFTVPIFRLISGEPQLLDNTAGEANAFDFSWSPAGVGLLYQQTRDDANGRSPRGPVMLRSEDCLTTQLLEGITDRSARWLSSERILTASSLMFEVIGTDGAVIASHTSTQKVDGTKTGAESTAMSPDGRWNYRATKYCIAVTAAVCCSEWQPASRVSGAGISRPRPAG